MAEAARCYREAGSHRRAADLHERLGRYQDAADDYARAGNRDLAAWLLVEYVGDPAAAREQFAPVPTIGPLGRGAPAPPALRRQLILARCDVAEGRPATSSLVAIAAAQAELSRPAALADHYVEPWSVTLAEAVRRPDQVALIFAAAVRGRRYGAEERWRTWMRDVLHADLILPAPAPGAAPIQNAR
jgi:hypothetical protein